MEILLKVIGYLLVLSFLYAIARLFFLEWTDETSEPAPDHKAIDDLSVLMGKSGRAMTDLRPIGTVLLDVDGERVEQECISEDGFIEKGQRVKITAQKGPSLLVRQV
jgi:membrane-bound ClpP family serine protease